MEPEQNKTFADKEIFDITDLAEYLGYSKRTIYALVADRKIPFIPLSSHALRFSRASIDKWLAKKEVKTVMDYNLGV